MARNCKHYCEESSYPYGNILPYNQVFSPKRLPYNKASWCKTCEVSVKPPSVSKIVITSNKGREEFIQKTKVICPCCMTTCRGGPLSKTNPKQVKPKLQQIIGKVGDKVIPINKRVEWTRKTKRYNEISLKELGLEKLSKRGIPQIKKDIKELLRIDTLEILKEYDKMVFGLEADPKYNLFDRIVEFLEGYNPSSLKYDRNVTPGEAQCYQRWVIRELDKYRKKHKLGLFGLTEEEEKREAQRRLEEYDRRRKEIGPNGRYVYPFPHIDKDGNEIKEESPDTQ